jgi:transcriptional regulator PpsR
VGATLASVFHDSAAQALQALLAAARTVGRRDPERLTLADGRTEVAVSASVFRQEQTPFLLVRLVPARDPGAAVDALAGTPTAAGVEALLQSYVSNARDGLVFTDPHGRIVSVNRAFANLAQLSAEEQARGAMLDRWLGRTGVEMGVLISNLRQHGSVGLFSTSLRGELGAVVEVEISASIIASAEGPTLAFAVRDIGRRLQGEEKVPDRISRSVSELAELVGRVPLRQIVLETTDLIERMCIETALQMTNGNRASAAQLLGLSRQSLYVKLRRFGLGGLGGEGDD